MKRCYLENMTGYSMEEEINRLKVFTEFSHKWEEHSGEESC